MINKHHTSIVSEKAVLGTNVTIGPYCIINENVKIGNNVHFKALALQSHARNSESAGDCHWNFRRWSDFAASLALEKNMMFNVALNV